MQAFTNCTERTWYKYSKIVNITKYFKVWWDNNCHKELENYRQIKRIEYWKQFKSIMKHNFFDLKIQEIANKNCRP